MKNKMNVAMPTDREIVITRVFDAPRDIVWDTMSKPELLKKWLFGPPGWEMTECVEDARVGGTFRWAWSGPGGAGMTMTGEYREIVPPERTVRTEKFEMGCGPGMGEQLTTPRRRANVIVNQTVEERRDGPAEPSVRRSGRPDQA